MKTIKFSHDYAKFFEDIGGQEKRRVGSLFDATEAYLLEVLKVEKKALSPTFVEYDTLIYVEDDGGERKYYPLPDGLLLILLFQTFEGYLFTTCRRWTEEKEAYYRGQRGESFEVVISDGGKE